jgi:hypothetical protein
MCVIAAVDTMVKRVATIYVHMIQTMPLLHATAKVHVNPLLVIPITVVAIATQATMEPTAI